MPRSQLFIFGGLPATGKTTLARQLAMQQAAAYLRIDTVEQGLRDLCEFDVEAEGYRLAYRIARDNLHLGISVVADSCNPLEITRDEWQSVATNADAAFINIEVTCTDEAEHRQRVADRASDIDGLRLPVWSDIRDRHFDPWSRKRIVIDTAGRSARASFDELADKLSLQLKHVSL